MPTDDEEEFWSHYSGDMYWQGQNNEAAINDFWSATPQTNYGIYPSDEMWEDAQEAWYNGWIATGESKEWHEEWRDRFYDISGGTEDSFDWDAFHEYLRAIGSP